MGQGSWWLMGAFCPLHHGLCGKGCFSSRAIVNSICCVLCRDLLGWLWLVISTVGLQGDILQPQADKFCRRDGEVCVGLYFLMLTGKKLCAGPFAALCSSIVFHLLWVLGCLLQETNNKIGSSRFLFFISLSPSRMLMAENIPWEDKRT